MDLTSIVTQTYSLFPIPPSLISFPLPNFYSRFSTFPFLLLFISFPPVFPLCYLVFISLLTLRAATLLKLHFENNVTQPFTRLFALGTLVDVPLKVRFITKIISNLIFAL